MLDVVSAATGRYLARSSGRYTADVLDVEEACRGMVRAVVPTERLLDEAYALAHRFIDGRSPVATAPSHDR